MDCQPLFIWHPDNKPITACGKCQHSLAIIYVIVAPVRPSWSCPMASAVSPPGDRGAACHVFPEGCHNSKLSSGTNHRGGLVREDHGWPGITASTGVCGGVARGTGSRFWMVGCALAQWTTTLQHSRRQLLCIVVPPAGAGCNLRSVSLKWALSRGNSAAWFWGSST